MNIGIISCYDWLQRTGNYGTLFQNMALQMTLRHMGHQTTWIALAPDQAEKRKTVLCKALYAFTHPDSIIRKAAEVKQAAVQKKFYEKHPRHISTFLDTYVSHTAYLSLPDLRSKGYLDQLDAYIVGSDNVWATVNPDYFLSFAPDGAPKLAYAASAPWEQLPESWAEKAAPYLESFNGISVRESAGLAWIQKAGYNAELVLDPTLLLTMDDYLPLFERRPGDANAAIAYVVNSADTLLPVLPELKKEAESLGVPLRVAALQGAEYDIPEDIYWSPSPGRWLKAFYEAPFIVTNSFHGLAFSIIMQRNFVLLPQRGKYGNANSRFSSLLPLLGLENRILDDPGQLRTILSQPIDWNDVQTKLNVWRSTSQKFLISSLTAQ